MRFKLFLDMSETESPLPLICLPFYYHVLVNAPYSSILFYCANCLIRGAKNHMFLFQFYVIEREIAYLLTIMQLITCMLIIRLRGKG